MLYFADFFEKGLETLFGFVELVELQNALLGSRVVFVERLRLLAFRVGVGPLIVDLVK